MLRVYREHLSFAAVSAWRKDLLLLFFFFFLGDGRGGVEVGVVLAINIKGSFFIFLSGKAYWIFREGSYFESLSYLILFSPT